MIFEWWTTDTKGGTFVEWLFNTTSFLPYIGNSLNDIFYQGLLFDACTLFTTNEWVTTYTNSLCNVSTRDNQVYTVALSTGVIRSDGTPLTIDDVYFTYADILVGNQWDIPALSVYSDITIERNINNTLKVTFPKKSPDNNLFFTQFILPKHILSEKDLMFYRDTFARQIVYTNCASIKPGSSDANSLIFDVTKCSDTKLWFYQIKTFADYESFIASVSNPAQSIIDVYVWSDQTSWYTAKELISNDYVSVFFNTTSERLRVRWRRSLAWLIQGAFYNGEETNYIVKDQWVFNKFVSTGTNVSEFLQRITPDASISKKDLEDSWVKALTGTSLQLFEKERKYAYYTTGKASNITIQLILDQVYDNVGFSIESKDFGGFKTLYKDKKEAWHTITASSFQPGLNTITFYTKNKEGKKINIGSLLLYILSDQVSAETSVADDAKITIIYQYNATSDFVIQRLKSIFLEAEILPYFEFVWFQTASELEGKLLTNTYDIAIMNIEKWLKRDIGPILRASEPHINPSQYVNPQFISLFDQYIQSQETSTAVRNQLQEIYIRDVPFIILGKEVQFLHVKDTMYNRLAGVLTGKLYEHTRRDIIYKNVVLTNNIHIDISQTKGISWFLDFVWDTLYNGFVPSVDAASNTGSTNDI